MAHSEKNKTILFVINSLEGGGAEKALCNWLMYMEGYFGEHGYSVHLATLDQCSEKYSPPSYVQRHYLDSKGSLFLSIRQLFSVFKKVQPSSCFSFLNRSNYAAILLAKLHSVPIAINERVNTTTHLPSGIRAIIAKALVKVLYPRADLVIAVSEGVKSELCNNYKVAPAHIRVITNAYDVDKIAGLASDNVTIPPYIIAVGRLSKNKNFSLLIDAYAETGLKQSLIILGEGPEEAALLAQIEMLGLQGKVKVHSFNDNPYSLLKNAEYLVSCSNSEGFPNVIAEALCLGLPVVATDCESGPAEILSKSRQRANNHWFWADYGILTPTNSRDELVAAMSAMSELGRQRYPELLLTTRAKDFNVSSCVDKIINVVDILNALLPESKSERKTKGQHDV
jgi:N-acetylgalactosamine-N,N'-diacetylbacillosaminyl-diphospho-undecaprenol 4-alpha-N-acetylgalactosaminyltransferase